MKTVRNNQQGIGHLVVVAVIVIVGLIGLVGLRVMRAPAPKATVSSGTSRVAPPVKAEIQDASKSLDDSSADSGISADQLDSDINSLL